MAALANLRRALVLVLSVACLSLATALLFCQLHSDILLNNQIFDVFCLTLFERLSLCFACLSLSLSVCFVGVLFSRVGLAVGPRPAAFGWTLMNGTGVGTSDEAGHAVN